MTSENSNSLRNQLIIWLFLPATLVLGICLSIPLYDWLMGMESDLATELTRKGPGRLTRRCMMLAAVILLPFLLKAIGWRGWRDNGWGASTARKKAQRDFVYGLLAGIGLMLVLVVASVLMGTRVTSIAYGWPKMIFSIFSFGVGAVVVGVLEETLARGVLFRCLARAYRMMPVMILVAVLFAWMHFLKADTAAYAEAPYLVRVGKVFVSACTGFDRIPHAYNEMLNLGLFSILLCLLLIRSRTVWLAAGFHAGVVWIKRLNSITTDSDHTHSLAHFFGAGSDFTDGWFCAVLLTAMIVFVAVPLMKTGVLRGRFREAE